MQQQYGKKLALVEAIENRDIRMVEENLMLCIHDKHIVYTGFCAACKSGDMNLVKIFTDNGYITYSILIEIHQSRLRKDNSQAISPSPVEAASCACLGGNLEIVKLFYEEESGPLKKRYNAVFGTALMNQELQITSRGYALLAASVGGQVDVVNFFLKNYITTDKKEDEGHVLNAIGGALVKGQEKHEMREITRYSDVVLALLNRTNKYHDIESKISLVKELAKNNKCVEFGETVVLKIIRHSAWHKNNSFWQTPPSEQYQTMSPELRKMIEKKAVELEVNNLYLVPGK